MIRNTCNWLAGLTVLLGCIGCDGGAHSALSPDSLFLVPNDLTTNVVPTDSLELGVSIVGTPDEVPEDAAFFEGGLSLVAWPSGEPVAGRASGRTFTPAEALGRGWYALRFDDSGLPDHFRMYGGTDHIHLARFHAGSLPLLRLYVQNTHGEADGEYTLVLRATEPVRTDDVTALLDVRFGDVDAECRLSHPELADQRQFLNYQGVDFLCARRVGGVPMTVALHQGVVSAADGTPLRDFAGRTDMSVTWIPFNDDGTFSGNPAPEEPTAALFEISAEGGT